jgi:hypothetical protein
MKKLTLKSLISEMDSGDVDSEFPKPQHSNYSKPKDAPKKTSSQSKKSSVKAFNQSPEEVDAAFDTVLSCVVTLGLFDEVKKEIIRLKTRYPEMADQDNKTLSIIQKYKDKLEHDIEHGFRSASPNEDGSSAEQERGWDDAEDSFRSGKL